MRKLRIIPAVVILLAIWTAYARESHETPVFDIDKPTILAFFRPSGGINKVESNANDSLSDFQAYLRKANGPLQNAGIEIHEVYARSFRIRIGPTITTYQTKKAGVGYYLVAPGKKPRIEYGVMTDADLIGVAGEYFGLKGK
jgi:hypothetical protein